MTDIIYKDGVMLTLNNMGHCIPELTEFSKKFVEFSKDSITPVLDMGAAYGPATIAALKNNAKVIANDIEERHLQYIVEAVKEPYRKNLTLCVGRIPGEVIFNKDTFKAIHASQVLHFLTGDEIEETARLMFDWLMPQGKVFIVAGTPYINHLKNFIPVYEGRKKQKNLWPGEIKNTRQYCENQEYLKNIPSFFNFLDKEVLERVFSDAGFIIEECKLFDRGNLPSHIALDGRENVGLIGVKPGQV